MEEGIIFTIQVFIVLKIILLTLNHIPEVNASRCRMNVLGSFREHKCYDFAEIKNAHLSIRSFDLF